MPTISVTNEEYESFKFFRSEMIGKLDTCEDEQYLAEYEQHSETFEKFREKYHNAKNQEDARKLVKKTLKIAKNKGL